MIIKIEKKERIAKYFEFLMKDIFNKKSLFPFNLGERVSFFNIKQAICSEIKVIEMIKKYKKIQFLFSKYGKMCDVFICPPNKPYLGSFIESPLFYLKII